MQKVTNRMVTRLSTKNKAQNRVLRAFVGITSNGVMSLYKALSPRESSADERAIRQLVKEFV